MCSHVAVQHEYELVPQDVPTTVQALKERYNDLLSQLARAKKDNDYANILAIEQHKLQALEAFYRLISGEQDAYPPEKPITHLWLRRLGLWTALPLAMSLNAIGEFLFIHDLLQLIPHISNPVLLLASAVCTLLTSLLYYTWEIELLRKALGIKHHHSKLAEQLECQTKQVKVAKKIMAHYENVRTIASTEDMLPRRDLVSIISDDFDGMKRELVERQEPLSFKLFKWSITGFGATMSIAGGFFYAKYLMLMLCPLMLTTPAGVILIAITCTISLTIFAAVRASGMMGIKSPELQHANQLKKELETFEVCAPETHQLVERAHTAIRAHPETTLVETTLFSAAASTPTVPAPRLFSQLRRCNSESDLSRLDSQPRHL